MPKEFRLTQMSRTAGCAAKIGPETLGQILGMLPQFEDQNLLVGLGTSDDAAVYKLTDEIAVIQTLDFFTPVADDPVLFGQIAAANALSDIYAMGGEPKLALNIVAFPNCLDPAVLGEILKGGASKVKEAGASLAGGHSIQDDEPKYGLSVMGVIHPDKIWTNSNAQEGDVLILTKQIGVGLVNTAVKAELASERAMKEAAFVMTSLNKKAKEIAVNYPVNSCTDITGFGLLGHMVEMAAGSGVSVELNTWTIPVIQEAAAYAEMGLVPEGAYRNRKYAEPRAELSKINEVMIDLLCDPQTSGGLMFSVPEEYALQMMAEFAEKGLETKAAVIGQVTRQRDKLIYAR